MFRCILIVTNQKGDAYLGTNPNISLKSMVGLSVGLHAFWSTSHAEPDFHGAFHETTLQTLI